MHKKCMVIDLDETLVHSSFKVNTNNYLNNKSYNDIKLTLYGLIQLLTYF